jgi:HAD superfamily hydrolase (TIGR01549 family)
MSVTSASNPPRAVCLDVGWTLIHPVESLWESFGAVGREAGADLSPEEVERLVHGLLNGNRQRALEEFESGTRYTDSDAEFESLFLALGRTVFGLTGVPGDCEDLTGRFLRRFWRPENWAVFPDVTEGMRRLRSAGIRVGVLSNAASNLLGFLGDLGLLDLCDFAIVSAIEGTKKPDRRIFDLALQRAGVAADSAVHVGDMYLEDVLGARRAGLRPLLIDRGRLAMFPNHPECAGDLPEPVEVVRSLTDVLDALGL